MASKSESGHSVMVTVRVIGEDLDQRDHAWSMLLCTKSTASHLKNNMNVN